MSYIKLFTTELKNKGLSLYDKAVYGSLVTKFQYHNGEFYTYEKFIADELEISESSVKRSIKKLTEVGLISINKKYHKQLKQTVNYYNINLDNDSISDVKNLEPDTAITQSEIMPENANNEPMQASETIEDTDNNNYQQWVNPQSSITVDDNIKDIKWYDEISEVIEDEFELTPEEYFSQFKDVYEFGYKRLEHISDKARENGNKITPDDVLTFFDTIREVA